MQTILISVGNDEIRLWASMGDGKMQWKERV